MSKLPNVSSHHGAPMGRRSEFDSTDYPVKFRMQRLRWVDGDYDEGGAYWGYVSGDHIYWAVGLDEDLKHEVFIRAKSRGGAKTLLREDFPNATFFN